MRRGKLWSPLLQTSETSLVHRKQGFTSRQPILFQESEKIEDLVIKLCKQSRPHDALEALASLNPSSITLSRDPLYNLLQSCLESNDLSAAQKIHCLIINNGHEATTVLLDHLIRLFAFCGSLPAAYQVFLKVPAASVYTWNAIISVHAQYKEDKKALALFDLMQKNVEIMPDKITHLCVLQACINLKDVASGRVLHARIVSSGLDADVVTGSSLIHMYAQCGYLQEMQQVFDVLPNHDLISWGAIVSAYAQYGHDKVVITLFESLAKEGVQLDRGLYVLFLKSCGVLGDLENGRMIHQHIRRGCFGADIFLQSALIDMYSACKDLHEAYNVFNKMMSRDLVAWGAMMSAYNHNSYFLSVLILFESMQEEGLEPDSVIFLCVVKACSGLGDLVLGRIIHEKVVSHSFDMHIVVNNTLLDFYAKCGSLEEASNVFDRLSSRDMVSWNIMVAAYADSGLVDYAFTMFSNMKHKGLSPDSATFMCMLRTCGMKPSATMGRIIHDEIIRSGVESDIATANGIVDMYARCQTLNDATKVFQTLGNRDIVTWSALLSGFTQQGDDFHVLNLFKELLQTGITLDEVVFLSALRACGSLQSLREGWLLNDKIIRSGIESRNVVANSLVCMYAKCGSLKESRKVFESLQSKDVVTWGAMIGGYAQHGQGYPALVLLENMLEVGVCPDQATLICALKACGSIRAAKECRLLHDLIIRSECVSYKAVGNALLDVYVRCGSLRQAHKIFDVLGSRDIISWTTVIVWYARYGHGYTVLELYKQLRQEGLQPTRVMYLCMLRACVNMGAINPGKYVYEEARKNGLVSDMAINNSLVELHAKWGDLEGAEQLLKSLPCRDVVTWSVLMTGFAACGKYRQVMTCLHAMHREGLKPDDIVFTIVLSACSNAGLLEETFVFFKAMVDDYALPPDLEHYSCVIDVLGRAGRPEEAIKLVHTLPNLSDDIAWRSILANSRTYGNTGSGFLSINKLQEGGKKCSGFVWNGTDGLIADDFEGIEGEVIKKEMESLTLLGSCGTFPASNNFLKSNKSKRKREVYDSDKLLSVVLNQASRKREEESKWKINQKKLGKDRKFKYKLKLEEVLSDVYM